MLTFGTRSQLNNSGKQCYPMNRYKLCSSCIVESTDIARETVTEKIETGSELESLMTNLPLGSNSDIKKTKFKYFIGRSQSRAP